MVVFSPCMDCKNYIDNSDMNCCKLYPDGIPDEVFFDGSGKLCETINKNKTHFEMIGESLKNG